MAGYITASGKKHAIPEGSTAQEAFEGLKLVLPELSNATLKKDGDNWKADVNFGKKG